MVSAFLFRFLFFFYIMFAYFYHRNLHSHNAPVRHLSQSTDALHKPPAPVNNLHKKNKDSHRKHRSRSTDALKRQQSPGADALHQEISSSTDLLNKNSPKVLNGEPSASRQSTYSKNSSSKNRGKGPLERRAHKRNRDPHKTSKNQSSQQGHGHRDVLNREVTSIMNRPEPQYHSHVKLMVPAHKSIPASNTSLNSLSSQRTDTHKPRNARDGRVKNRDRSPVMTHGMVHRKSPSPDCMPSGRFINCTSKTSDSSGVPSPTPSLLQLSQQRKHQPVSRSSESLLSEYERRSRQAREQHLAPTRKRDHALNYEHTAVENTVENSVPKDRRSRHHGNHGAEVHRHNRHALNGSAHEFSGNAHALNGSTHALNGSTHALNGSTHALNGSTHALNGNMHGYTNGMHKPLEQQVSHELRKVNFAPGVRSPMPKGKIPSPAVRRSNGFRNSQDLVHKNSYNSRKAPKQGMKSHHTNHDDKKGLKTAEDLHPTAVSSASKHAQRGTHVPNASAHALHSSGHTPNSSAHILTSSAHIPISSAHGPTSRVHQSASNGYAHAASVQRPSTSTHALKSNHMHLPPSTNQSHEINGYGNLKKLLVALHVFLHGEGKWLWYFNHCCKLFFWMQSSTSLCTLLMNLGRILRGSLFHFAFQCNIGECGDFYVHASDSGH